MKGNSSLIPAHGGFRRLKSFQLAQLVYDITVRFCSLYVDRKSRTRDQMVQAARSGTQNIAEGRVAEEKAMQQEHGHTDTHGRTQTDTDPQDPKIGAAQGRSAKSVSIGDRPCSSVSAGGKKRLPQAVYVANAALSLLNLCCYLLDRQLAVQARAFEHDGGFTELLYRARTKRRGF